MNTQIFKIKQFDTLPSLKISITAPNELNSMKEFSLKGVSGITFTMVKKDCEEIKIQEQTASTLCLSAGTIQYEWSQEDTNEYGSFLGEFVLYYNGGDRLTIPQNGSIPIEITKSLNPFKS